MDGLPKFDPRSSARRLADPPGLGDDIPCSKCGSALDTGLECTVCGHDMAPEVYPQAAGTPLIEAPDLPGFEWAVASRLDICRGYFRPSLRNPGGAWLSVCLRVSDMKWVGAWEYSSIDGAEPFDTPEECLLWLQLQGFQRA